MTTRSQVSFKVRQYVNGQPWIFVEEHQGDPWFFGSRPPHGTTFDRAEEIAEYLNGNIEAVTHTVSD